MNRKLRWLLTVLVFASIHLAEAQQPTKVHQIGFLAGGSLATNAALIEAFRQNLRELGYIEGQNITIEYRASEGRDDRLPGLAAELVRLKVHLIVAWTTPAARAAKNATTTIPIVMVGVGDPVGTRLVASLAQPGANLTGLTSLSPELSGKRLELLKEVVPSVSRVARHALFALWRAKASIERYHQLVCRPAWNRLRAEGYKQMDRNDRPKEA
jgi:ABC-type uncharacterized transport system substrate-binding protein